MGGADLQGERDISKDGMRVSTFDPTTSTGEKLCLLLLAAVFLACPRAQTEREGAPSPADVTASDDRPVILCLGTSLTAGLGLDPAQAYPALVQARLDAEALRYRVVNAGVSGESSAGALRRIDWVLQLRQQVAILIVETGANDGLRGQPPDATRANIRAILERGRRQSPPPKLLLAGMQAPPNLGAKYAHRFRALYPELAREQGAALVPFLLENVAGVPELNQADGIHPTAEGQKRVAENVWQALRPLLR